MGYLGAKTGGAGGLLGTLNQRRKESPCRGRELGSQPARGRALQSQALLAACWASAPAWEMERISFGEMGHLLRQLLLSRLYRYMSFLIVLLG